MEKLYDKTAKNRIANLTKKCEKLKDKRRSYNFCKRSTREADKLRSKYSKLDSNYTNEFEKRVTTNIEAAKAKLAASYRYR